MKIKKNVTLREKKITKITVKIRKSELKKCATYDLAEQREIGNLYYRMPLGVYSVSDLYNVKCCSYIDRINFDRFLNSLRGFPGNIIINFIFL